MKFSMNNPRPIPEEIKEYLSYDSITGIITWLKKIPRSKITVGDKAGCLKKRGYIIITFKGKSYLAHRIAWFLYYGYQPPQLLDHDNASKDDNSIDNLRECTHQENMRNQKTPKNNLSGTTGVGWHKPSAKWMVRISANNKRKNLGLFTNLKDAIECRKDAEKKHYKEFMFNKKRGVFT